MKKIILIVLLLTGLYADNIVEQKKKLCEDGDNYQCWRVGSMYYRGDKVKKNLVEAEKYLNKSCKEDITLGCVYLGLIYTDKKNYSDAAEFYKKSCESGLRGYEMGCNLLGEAYYHGRGIKQNSSKTAEFYSKACNGGHIISCNNLAYMYNNGIGVHKDYSMAVRLHRKACDKNESIGCFNLGLHYYHGQGIRQSDSKAKEFWHKACDLGYADGCNNYEKIKTL